MRRRYRTPTVRRVGGGRSRTRTCDPLIKRQLLARSEQAAILLETALDEIDHVPSEVVILPPQDIRH